jgi:hypothetical protein
MTADSGRPRPAAVTVIHGANDDEFDVAGSRVQDVRHSLVDAFNIPNEAAVFVNGVSVPSHYVLQPNDTLEFCLERGIKGSRRMLTRPEILAAYTGYPADVMEDMFATLSHDEVNEAKQAMWHEAALDEWLDGRYARKRADDGPDMVIPPHGFRISGAVYGPLTRNEWRLIECLLATHPTPVMVEDVITHVYGDGISLSSTSNRLKQAMKRLNEKSIGNKWPVTVHVENGWVSLVK